MVSLDAKLAALVEYWARDAAEWRARAVYPSAIARGEVSYNDFYPHRGDREAIDRARAVCASCPVTAECRDYALSSSLKQGIWGGMSERQRRAYARTRRRGGIANDDELIGKADRLEGEVRATYGDEVLHKLQARSHLGHLTLDQYVELLEHAGDVAALDAMVTRDPTPEELAAAEAFSFFTTIDIKDEIGPLQRSVRRRLGVSLPEARSR